MGELKMPERGFTKTERAWLAELVQAINTLRAIKGRNTTVDKGQVINADDCEPCP